LNRTEVFQGYEEVLRPHLNLDLIKAGKKPLPTKGKF